MNKEIGSIYQINIENLGYEDVLNDYIVKDMLTNGYRDWCSVSCGRDALILSILQIENKIKGSIKCMVPMYVCDSIDNVFDYYGWDINYYPINKNMQPAAEEFEAMIKETQPEVIFIHGYYGINNIEPIVALLQEYRGNGGIVIEDITQYIGYTRQYLADYYIASLRKWAPIPDGGILISRDDILHKPMMNRSDFVKAKWTALTEKQDYLTMVTDDNYDPMQDIKADFLNLNRNAEEMLDNNHNIYAMSNLAIHLWNICDIEKTFQTRSVNAEYLYKNMHDIVGITSPLRYTGAEAPLYYPIYVDNRDYFQEYMRTQNIYLPVLWPVSLLNNNITDDTRYIYDHLLGIPCDERYDICDMQRIVNACKTALENNE